MLRHQLAVAERERPGARSRLTWPDRAWLALLAGTLPAERLAAMRLIVTPGTILRWHRDIVRRRWDRRSRRGRSGRPATHRKVRSEVLRLARENESWGYRRIHGELAGLGITVAPSTVWEILKRAGIEPAPRRDGPGWPEFLRSQAQGILALDFFTADLLNGTRVYVLAAIEHGTRRIWILGATGHPIQAWVVQQARNLLMDLEDAGTRVKFVIHDRDASFTLAFDDVFMAAGARVIRSAVQAPRMNSIIERWIGNCRRELLDRTLIWNQRHLMTVLREYEDFQPGSPGALLHRGPLRTTHARSRARGPSKPLGRFRSSAAARWFPPAGPDACSGGRWRVRGVFACCARRWAFRGRPGSPP